MIKTSIPIAYDKTCKSWQHLSQQSEHHQAEGYSNQCDTEINTNCQDIGSRVDEADKQFQEKSQRQSMIDIDKEIRFIEKFICFQQPFSHSSYSDIYTRRHQAQCAKLIKHYRQDIRKQKIQRTSLIIQRHFYDYQ